MKASGLIGVWARRREAIAFNVDGTAVISHTSPGLEKRVDATWRWANSEAVVVRQEREDHPSHEVRFDILDDDTIAIRKGKVEIAYKRHPTA